MNSNVDRGLLQTKLKRLLTVGIPAGRSGYLIQQQAFLEEQKLITKAGVLQGTEIDYNSRSSPA
jgi:hypothetical protein